MSKITLLPDGSPEAQARMAKSAALAEKLILFLNAQKVTDGTVIEAIGLIFGGFKSDTKEQSMKRATEIATAIQVCFALKEKARG